jgi:DNA primase
MTTSPQFQAWVGRARDVPIEHAAGNRQLTLRRASRVEWHGPCPLCGGTDRFFINVRKQCFYCRGCDRGGDVIAFVQFFDRCDFIEACKRLSREPPPPASMVEEARRRKQRDAAEIDQMVAVSRQRWRQTTALSGTLGECYLRDVRCIALDVWPATLRFHRGLFHREARRHFPAIVAPVQNAAGEFRGIWRIFLDPETTDKAPVEEPRLGLGEIAGNMVRLTPIGPEVVVSEGIESGLAALMADPSRSHIAALSASHMRRLKLPECVRSAILVEENDLPDKLGRRASPDAVRAFSSRLIAEGRRVSIARPPQGAKDFNDCLLEKARVAS